MLLVFIKLIMCDFSTNSDKKLLYLHFTNNTQQKYNTEPTYRLSYYNKCEKSSSIPVIRE